MDNREVEDIFNIEPQTDESNVPVYEPLVQEEVPTYEEVQSVEPVQEEVPTYEEVQPVEPVQEEVPTYEEVQPVQGNLNTSNINENPNAKISFGIKDDEEVNEFKITTEDINNIQKSLKENNSLKLLLFIGIIIFIVIMILPMLNTI